MEAYPLWSERIVLILPMKRILKSEFVRNVLALMSGNVMVLAITMGSAPIMTRLYLPENFGLLALFMASVTVVSSVGSLCYERAILLPGEEREAINLFFLSLAILFLITALSCVAVALYSFIGNGVDDSSRSFWLWLVPIGILLSGMTNIIRFWRMRRKAFRWIALARVSNVSVSAVIKIAIGFGVGASAGGLIGGTIAGFITALVFLVRKPDRFDFRRHLRDVSRGTMRDMAKEYRKFPLFATWNTLFNTLSQNLVVFLLSFFFTPVVVGLYSLGNRILKQPVILLSTSVQNVYFQKSARQVQTGVPLMPGLVKSSLALFLIGLLPFGLLGAYGHQVFGFVFGSRWEMAGRYVQVMSPWFVFLFAAAPANIVFEVYRKQDLKLYLNLSKVLLVSAVLVIGGIFFKDPLVVIMLFALVNLLGEAVTIGFGFYLAGLNDKKNNQGRMEAR